MTSIRRLHPTYVDAIPGTLQAGQLYISKRYGTAVHLCCCGCGLEVVTPLNKAKWRLTEHDNTVSLSPSIGNWSFPCKSHYWIQRNEVQWSRAMTNNQIARVRERDRRAVDVLGKRGVPDVLNAAGSPLISSQDNPAFWQRLLRRVLGI